MLKAKDFEIARIRVPAKRVRTRDDGKVAALAERILEEGLQIPIQVRADGDDFVLIEGLHRLEACRALGETTIRGYLVQARKH